MRKALVALSLLVAAHTASAATITAKPQHPVVSAGWWCAVEIRLQHDDPTDMNFPGTLTVREGSQRLLQEQGVPLMVLVYGERPVGTTTLTVEYSGDASTGPLSTTCTQIVTADTTTTTGSIAPNPVRYGEPAVLTLQVTSSTGATPDGTIGVFELDGSLRRR